jgi:hypothetical protein
MNVVLFKGTDSEIYTSLLARLISMRRANEKLRMPGATFLAPEDEPTMFHENMLMYCYGQMEVLRALYKLVEKIRGIVLNPKIKTKLPHPMKSKLPKDFDVDLLLETQICFQSILDLAKSYTDLLLSTGVKAITAQVRWGETGEALKSVLSDDDVEFYAKEYVDSALEAWRGVLKVKLK